MRLRHALIAFSFTVAAGPAAARIGFQNNIPNGATFSCLACHNSASGGASDEWNSFGDTIFVENGGDADDPETVDADGEDFSFWSKAICEADSDDDGASNGLELGDPDCVWKLGDDPSSTTGITNPSDPASVPALPDDGGCSAQRVGDGAPWSAALVLIGGIGLLTRRRARR